MASAPSNTPAMQPGLRSFIVYSEIPDGCITFEVPNDEALPHLRAGEFIIIDPEDRDPADGELFAITWKSDWRRRWQIVRMDQRWGRYGKTGHSTACEERNLWFVGEVTARPMMNLAGQRVGEPVRWADGPYDDAYCRDICHGKIIGIYAPDFRAKLKERA